MTITALFGGWPRWGNVSYSDARTALSSSCLSLSTLSVLTQEIFEDFVVLGNKIKSLYVPLPDVDLSMESLTTP